MPTKVTKTSKREALVASLKAETAKGPDSHGWVDPNDSVIKALLAARQITINDSIKKGKLVAARYELEPDADTTTVVPNGAAHPNGAADGEKMETLEENEVQPLELVDMDGKEVMRGMLPLEPKRGGAKKEDYPWSKMEVGDSFLVPVTDKYPEPWVSFQSNVASNVRRFSAEVPGEVTAKGNPKRVATRKFSLRRVTKGDQYPNGYIEPSDGARVFRTH